MKCPQCGHQNAKHYKFCLECGAEIPSTNVESSQRNAVKRVGFSDAFEAQPERNPSPETLIRQVEDISSGIGMGNPLTTPPPLGLKSDNDRAILNKFSTPASAKDLLSSDRSSILDSKLSPSASSQGLNLGPKLNPLSEPSRTKSPLLGSDDDLSPQVSIGDRPVKSGLLGGGLTPEEGSSPDLDFHTNLNKGKDSLADFERELFGGALAEGAERLKGESNPEGEEKIPQLLNPEEASRPKEESEPPTPAPLLCRKCSATIPKDFLFCGKCGTKVEVAQEPLSEPAHQTEAKNVAEEQGASLQSPSAVVELEENSVSLNPEGSALDLEPPKDHLSSSSRTKVQLVHIHLDGSEGEFLDINENSAILGRDHSWDIFESDEYLSPQHARIEINDQGEVTLTDLGGINGIFLRLTKPVTLSSGDFFRAGQQLFAYEALQGDPIISRSEGTKTLGSPVYETWGRLSHIVGQGEVGRSWLLHGELMTLGRVKGDIVFDQDRFMSSRHCSLTLSQSELILTDQGSTNGTFVRIREKVKVQDGDLILLGQKIFKVKTV